MAPNANSVPLSWNSRETATSGISVVRAPGCNDARADSAAQLPYPSDTADDEAVVSMELAGGRACACVALGQRSSSATAACALMADFTTRARPDAARMYLR